MKTKYLKFKHQFDFDKFNNKEYDGLPIDISLYNIKLDMDTLNKLLKKCNNVHISKCTIYCNESNIIINNNSLYVHSSIFKNRTTLNIERNHKEQKKVISFISLMSCEFEESTQISISNLNINLLNVINCTNINKLNLKNNIIQLLDTRKTKCILSATFTYIIDILSDRYFKTDKIINSSNNINYSIFGRKLEFDLTGFKKVLIRNKDNYEDFYEALLELLIPKDSYINTGNGSKCRSDKVIPIKLYNLEKEPKEIKLKENEIILPLVYNSANEYIIGEVYYPDSFNLTHETCSNGVHFFLNKELALNY